MSDLNLESLLRTVRDGSGLLHKRDIQRVQRQLLESPALDYPNGDDAAVIPNGEHFDLLAGEGFMDQFVAADPWFAGWCGVLVNVSDIAAMGGRPVAVVNALWGGADPQTERLLQGMCAASRAYGVPIVGGHTNLQCAELRLSVSILGRAQRVLSSFSARPGQHLVMAVDLRGQYQPPFNNWNASTRAPAERLRQDIELLPQIAESQLATAAKDISQAGLLGTCVMLLESSNVGAHIQLEQVPKPEAVSWPQWLQTFPSFGFLLTCDDAHLGTLLSLFTQRSIHAAAIGRINDSGLCTVSWHQQSDLFWDLRATPLTGMRGNDMRSPDVTRGD
ncbi:sll0787 family AIR synthase-like protein [Ketobacter sp.]|uniref:sll0787 family AIR synthase-like protein n=1 Tax=Ketobacter sp. TaxID=2083498 RepID=UPI000F0E94E4|nr:sll0787 family AIR synthase-like protein [Ketobacter sp.]RLT92165.1 MAG: sll0787 family AIR synthase-like protein [Ketobacter sp.]